MNITPVFLGFLRLADTEHRVAILTPRISFGVSAELLSLVQRSLTWQRKSSETPPQTRLSTAVHSSGSINLSSATTSTAPDTSLGLTDRLLSWIGEPPIGTSFVERGDLYLRENESRRHSQFVEGGNQR